MKLLQKKLINKKLIGSSDVKGQYNLTEEDCAAYIPLFKYEYTSETRAQILNIQTGLKIPEAELDRYEAVQKTLLKIIIKCKKDLTGLKKEHPIAYIWLFYQKDNGDTIFRLLDCGIQEAKLNKLFEDMEETFAARNIDIIKKFLVKNKDLAELIKTDWLANEWLLDNSNASKIIKRLPVTREDLSVFSSGRVKTITKIERYADRDIGLFDLRKADPGLSAWVFRNINNSKIRKELEYIYVTNDSSAAEMKRFIIQANAQFIFSRYREKGTLAVSRVDYESEYAWLFRTPAVQVQSAPSEPAEQTIRSTGRIDPDDQLFPLEEDLREYEFTAEKQPDKIPVSVKNKPAKPVEKDPIDEKIKADLAKIKVSELVFTPEQIKGQAETVSRVEAWLDAHGVPPQYEETSNHKPDAEETKLALSYGYVKGVYRSPKSSPDIALYERIENLEASLKNRAVPHKPSVLLIRPLPQKPPTPKVVRLTPVEINSSSLHRITGVDQTIPEDADEEYEEPPVSVERQVVPETPEETSDANAGMPEDLITPMIFAESSAQPAEKEPTMPKAEYIKQLDAKNAELVTIVLNYFQENEGSLDGIQDKYPEILKQVRNRQNALKQLKSAGIPWEEVYYPGIERNTAKLVEYSNNNPGIESLDGLVHENSQLYEFFYKYMHSTSRQKIMYILMDAGISKKVLYNSFQLRREQNRQTANVPVESTQTESAEPAVSAEKQAVQKAAAGIKRKEKFLENFRKYIPVTVEYFQKNGNFDRFYIECYPACAFIVNHIDNPEVRNELIVVNKIPAETLDKKFGVNNQGRNFNARLRDIAIAEYTALLAEFCRSHNMSLNKLYLENNNAYQWLRLNITPYKGIIIPKLIEAGVPLKTLKEYFTQKCCWSIVTYLSELQ